MAAPAMAADPIKIGVGGYYQFFVQAGQIEGVYALNGTSTQYKGVNFIQEGEIHFIGQTKLDNGTTVGLTVELEGWNPSVTSTVVGGHARQIDEAFLFAFGDWGRVEFGSRDAASYRMYLRCAVGAVGLGLHPAQLELRVGQQRVRRQQGVLPRHGLGTIGGQFQDANRINYFTPRFAGLQIGVGYAPKINLNPERGYGSGRHLAGVCGFNDATTSPNCPTNDYSWQDVFDIGANYLNKFGDVTVALYGAFMQASFVPGFSGLATAGNMITGANLGNWKQWVAGAQFGFAGFTVGGSDRLRQQRPRRELLHRRRQRHPLLHRRHVRNRSVADVGWLDWLVQRQR